MSEYRGILPLLQRQLLLLLTSCIVVVHSLKSVNWYHQYIIDIDTLIHYWCVNINILLIYYQ